MDKCPIGEHSRVEALLEELCSKVKQREDADKSQWTEINKRVTTRTIWTGLGLFVVIMMAVVTFLWGTQSSDKNEILSELKSVTSSISGRGGIGERLTIIETQLDVINPKKKEDLHGRRKPGEISQGNPTYLGKE